MPAVPYETEFNPRTGLWRVRDERGPVLGYEDIETRGDAESRALELTEADRVQALEDAADLDDFEAAATVLAFGLDALLAEAA